MESIKLITGATLEFTNSSPSPLIYPSEHPVVSTEWDLVVTIIPPYIFSLSVLGIFLNGFVLAVFVANRERLTVAETYLCNLAVADFVLLCGLPFWAMNILYGFNWPYGDALCKLVNSVITINFYTSIYSLVMISIDRYLALVKTMSARWLRRTLYAKLICFILWILGLLLSTPTFLHRKVLFIEEYNITSCILDYAHDSFWKLAHHILINVAGFLLPVLVIVFCSGSIIKVLAQRRETLGFQHTHDNKATLLVSFVTLLFIFCWGPFHVFTFLDTLCDVGVLEVELWSHTLDVGGQVSVYLAFLNSTMNPLLYVFSGQYFKKKIIAIYRRKRYLRRGSDMTTFQRSIASTYINRTEQIKAVVILNPKEHLY